MIGVLPSFNPFAMQGPEADRAPMPPPMRMAAGPTLLSDDELMGLPPVDAPAAVVDEGGRPGSQGASALDLEPTGAAPAG